MIRLVVVDDDIGLLETMREVLSGQPDLCLRGVYDSAAGAMEGTDWTDVDVLVTDLDMPETTGMALIAAATQSNPSLFAIAYTVHEHRDSLYAALRAGASGYLLKGGDAMGLCDAVRSAARGESPVSPSVACHLLRELRSLLPNGSVDALTERECEILQALANGFIYKEVADRLRLSIHTVHTHVKRIHGKLHAATREDAIRLARSRGYLR